MGFFDSIFKGVKRDLEHNLERQVANSVANAVNNSVQHAINNQNGSNTGNNLNPSTIGNHQGYTVPSSNPQPQPTYSNVEYDGGNCIIDGIDYSRNYNCNDAHFRQILLNSFPGMELREDVPFKEIVPDVKGAFLPVKFLLSQGGVPKVFVDIRYPRQGTRTQAMRQSKQHGIGYVSLWRDYKNQEEYVVKRIKDALWS